MSYMFRYQKCHRSHSRRIQRALHMMELFLFLILTFSCVFTAEASNPAFQRSLEILDEASLAVKPTVPPEDRQTEDPDDEEIFGPRYAEINVKGVPVAIPEEDRLPPESHIEVERTERQTEPDKNLMVACLIILLVLIVMLGTCAALFCYLRRFKDEFIPKASEDGKRRESCLRNSRKSRSNK